ncbi:YbjN domain-containing protein [Collinsella sp. An2]|uniref:YbjN domain-containing protein n=1 Tax=Collinsella sp. An2 TaxID=1965585 RepID=UPI000B37E455|nr:YbjN domain-containing protein [Collinsella sp. An2]OUP09720.1 hypothetical protein B5F33_03780 [Collinsella sp. An2]
MYDNSIALMRDMSDAGIEYRSDTPLEDDNLIDTIRVGWEGSALPRTTILLRINDRGAHLEATLGTLGAGKRTEALELVNACNANYRWVMFYVDEDGAVVCTSDVYLVPEVAGLFGIAAVGRMFDTMNEVYPRLREVLA